MKLARLFLTLGLILVLAACQPVESLNPLYTEEDLVFDPELVGSWAGDGEHLEGTFTFQRSTAKELRLTVVGQDQEKIEYDAHLVQLGDYHFLDVTPEHPFARIGSHKVSLRQSDKGNNFEPHLLKVEDLFYVDLHPEGPDAPANTYEIRFLQAHWFFRIRIDRDAIRLAQLDDEWVTKKIDQGEINISYERSDGNLVLTANTKELQEFALDHAEDTEAFVDLGEMRRQE